MANRANVSISALENLRAGLKRFSSEVESTLSSSSTETRRVVEWLEQVHAAWARELRVRMEYEADAEAALSACERSGYYDEDGYYRQPDCSHESAELMRARRLREQAEEMLATAQRHQQTIDQIVADLDRQTYRLRTVGIEDAQSGTQKLDEQIAALQAFGGSISIGRAAGVVGGAIGSAIGASISRGLPTSPSTGAPQDPGMAHLNRLVEEARADDAQRTAEAWARINATGTVQTGAAEARQSGEPEHQTDEVPNTSPPGNLETQRSSEIERSPESVEGSGSRLERGG